LNLLAKFMIFRHNPSKHPSLEKKFEKIYLILYSSIMQLQVALWTFPLSKPSVSSPWSVRLFYWNVKHMGKSQQWQTTK
jgi:hypothetical protein